MSDKIMWIEETKVGTFKVQHKLLGCLAEANDWHSAHVFFNNWHYIHTVTDEDIVEVLCEDTMDSTSRA